MTDKREPPVSRLAALFYSCGRKMEAYRFRNHSNRITTGQLKGAGDIILLESSIQSQHPRIRVLYGQLTHPITVKRNLNVS